MVAKEINLEPVQENSIVQDFDDAEDTLSFCDLPLNSNASDWDSFSKEEQSSSFDQDYFEFFSEDFTASTYPADNIIFCGKAIPYKAATVAENAQNLEITLKPKNAKTSSIFPWKSYSLNKSRTNSLKQQQEKGYKTCSSLPVGGSDNNGCVTSKCGDKYDFSMKKASISATPLKSRWYLFAFGVGRFPMEMGLRNMKTRQSRKSPSKMFQSNDGRENVNNSSGKKAKSLWGLLRALASKRRKANAIVKASLD